MPSNNSQINIGVKYNVDQASVNAVKKSLQDLQNIKIKDFNGPKKELDQIKETAGKVQAALTKAFNVNLNSLNTKAFSAALNQAKLDIDKIYNQFNKAGAQGQVAFSRMASSVLTTNLQLRQTNSLVSRMGETMANTVKWGIASSVMNNFTNSVQQAFSYVKNLDSSLNDIRIVTKQSADQMANFAVQANNSAQSLGRSTMDYTKAALTFYQQGLDEATVRARTQSVLKAQNITGAGQEMADYLTAVWNGYKVANEEAELYVDKLAAVADSSASNMSELAVAMSKVASSANMLGVPVDKLNAQIATITATTRQAPQSVGNALKTIYSRINDISTGAEDAEISLGNYSSKMLDVGISVLDANGNLRDTGDVIDEIGGKWQNLSREQQIYLARTMAGQRQYNNLLALFDNWSKYSDLVNISMQAQGTTAQKNAIYMESLAAKMEQLGAAGERVKAALIDEKDLKGLVDFGTGAVNLFGNLIESIGGGKGALLTFGSVFTQIFSGTIAKQINNVVTNFQNAKNNIENINESIQKIRFFGQSEGYRQGIINQMVDAKEAAKQYYKFMTNAQINQHDQLIKNIAAAKEQVLVTKERRDEAEKFAKSFAMSQTAKGQGLAGSSMAEKILSEDFQQLSGTALLTVEALQKQINNFSFQTPKEGLENLKSSFNQLKNAVGTAPLKQLPGFSQYQDALDAIRNKAQPTETEVRRVEIALSNLLEQANVRISDAGALKQLNDEAKRAEENLTFAQKAARQYLQNVQQFAGIKAFVGVTAGIGQMASALNTVDNLFKTLRDDSISYGEKVTKVFMSGSMAVGMFVNGFLQIQRNIGPLIGSIGAITVTTGAHTTATIADIAATEGLTVAMGHLAIAAATAMAPLLPFIAVFGAIALAAYAVQKSINQVNQEAKKSEQATKKAKQAYDGVRESYDKLKSSLNDLSSSRDHLDSLTRGTQEWRDALEEVNQKVLSIAQEFPQLQGQIRTTSEGILEFTKEGQKQLLELYRQRTITSNLSYARANEASTQAKNNALITNASRDLDYSMGGLTAEELQQVVDVVGRLGDTVLTQTNDYLEKYTSLSPQSIEVVRENAEKVAQLAIQVNNNTAAARNLTRSIINSSFSDNQKYSKYDPEVLYGLANTYLQQASKELDYSKYSNKVQTGDLQVEIADEDALLNRYTQILKQRGVIDSISTAEKNGSSGIKYEAKTGETVKIDWDSVMKEIAEADAAAMWDTFVEQAAQEIDKLGEKASENLSKIGNSLEEIDWSQFSQKQIKDLLGYGTTYNEEIQSWNLSEEAKTAAEAMGLTQEQFRQELEKQQQLTGIGIQNYVKSLSKSAQQAFDEIIPESQRENISQATAQAIGNLLEDSLSKGIDSFKNTQSILDELNPQDIIPFSDLLSQVDSSTSLEDFKEKLEEADIQLNNINDISLAEFIKGLKEAEEELISPEENYKNLHDIVDKLRDGSTDTITAQQAEILDKAGIDVEEYFSHMADGSLKLEADAQEFYNTVNETSLEGFKEKIKELEEESQKISGLQNLSDQDKKALSQDVKQADLYTSLYGREDSKAEQTARAQLDSQLQFLDLLDLTEDQQTKLNDILLRYTDNQRLSIDDLRTIGELVRSNLDNQQGLEQKQKDINQQIRIYNEQLDNANKAQEERNYIKDQQLRTISQLNDRYFSLFDNQEEHYDTEEERAEAMERYAEALKSVSDNQMQDLGFDVDQYEDLVKLLIATNQEYEENQYLARQVAKANMRISRGMDDLIDNWDKWNDAILDFQENADFSSLAENWNEIRQALSNLFNSDEQTIDLLGPDFIAKNLDKIQAVKNGTEGAYEELAALMDQQLILNAYGVSDFSQLDQDVQDAYNLIQQTNADATIQVGAVFTGEDDLVAAFNRIVENANWTSTQAQAAFAQMGYDVQVQPKESAMHTDSQSTEYYVPPTYRMVPKEFNFGPFGRGTMLLPELDTAGHYESGGSGTKQTYEPGAYAIRTVTKNGKGFGGNISRGAAKSAAPRSGGGGGKGGGGRGGGGKSPKTSTPKQATQQKPQTLSEAKSSVDDRSDVYHDINLALEKQEDKLDDIQNKQKKLVNKDRLKNLQQQNKQLEKQKDLLDQKSGIAASELVRLRNEIVKDLGDGIKFDKNGQIANYNAALDKARDNYNSSIADYNKKVLDAENAYNKYVDQYNSMSGDAQEANKKELEHQKDLMEAAKKSAEKSLNLEKDKYDAIKDNIKEYEDTLKLQRDIANEQQEIQDKIYENLIAMSKIKVDLSIDTGDFERDWLDFENKFIKKLDKDDFLGSAKASAKELMSYFNSKQVQQTADQIRKIRNQIDIMNRGGTSNIYGTNLAQAKEDLEDYMKQQMDDLQDIQDKVDDIKENYLDAIDDAKDKMEDQIDQYERVNDLVEHNMKMVELLYGDKAYDSMQKYYGLQQENNERELESLRKQQEYWKQKMDNEVVGSDAWQKFKDNLDDVTDDLNNKLEDMIDNLSDRWENRVDGIIARLNNALTGGRGLDYLDEQWDYINNYDDQFLDTFESKTGIDEVERLYQSTIDGLAGSPKSQQALNKLMNDQLKLLREKDHLTEYDLERAKASLEVQKARLALEQARDNKTKMRLRRDSQGNYTYQYVADEEKLGELQAALADAQANLYETDKDHYKQNLNNLYDTYKEYIEKMRDLTEEYNNTQDAEERKRIQGRMDLLKESTNKLMSGLTQDNKYLLQYLNGSFFDGMGVDTSTLTMEEQMEIMEQNIPQMQSNIQDLSDIIVGQGGILPATADMMKEINEATIQYDKDVQSMLNSAGTSLQTIQQATDAQGVALDKNITDAQNLITANDELIKSCQAQIEAMEKLLDYMDKYINKIMSVQTLLSNLRSAYNTGQNLNGSNLTADNIGMTDWGMDTTGGMEYTGNPKTDAAAIKQQIDALMAQYEKFLAGMSIATFDTGGYTGSWGDAEGRLAFLHQGELVLNQDDTQNILNAVQVVRGMANAINSFASGEINSIMSGANGLLTGISNTEHLDQNVHIEANFPNVTQHTEIEQAFNNLVNMASMRASGYRD